MRTSLLGLLSLALAGPAFAASELQLDSNMPVVLYMDGEARGTVQPHEPLLVDIEPGVHDLKIQGILGKDLYDRDLIFDDDTRTELVWQRKQLRLGQVVKLDPNRPPPPSGETLPIVPEHPQAPPAPPAETETETQVAEAPLARPARPEKPAKASPPPPEQTEVAKAPPSPAPPPRAPAVQAPPPTPVFANTAPPTRDVAPPRPVPTGKNSGTVLIEAREGLDLQIAHGTQLLKVTVENGELIVVDANGTEIRFPSEGEAW